MKNPLISVLMTAFNRELYIAEAIESVLASTFQDFELIIVDDCSVDSTLAIAKKYVLQNSKIKLYVNEVNLGQFKNRNKAASLASGTFIKFFDSDDVMHNDLLEITVQAMLAYPTALVGIECIWSKIPTENLPVLFSSREAYINHFFKGNDFLHFGPSSSIMKKSLFDECKGYDEGVGILADTLLMLRAATLSPVVGYQPNLFFWRRHQGQVTVEQQNYYQMFCQRHQINSIILASNTPLSKEEVDIIKQNYKNIFLRNLFKYIWSIKNPRKLYTMFKIMDIKFVDLFKALHRNKTVGY